MYCSRMSMLFVLASVAACATRDDAGRTKGLSRDSALIAELETQNTHQLRLPDACRTVAPQPQATVRRMIVAKELARQAGEAEILGNLRDASALLRRASALDATDPSTAYHLGRVSEAILDSTGAVAAYCRYLTLGADSIESADVRRRVDGLSQSVASKSTHVGQSLATHQPAPSARMRQPIRRQATPRSRVLARSSGAAALPRRSPASTRPAITGGVTQASARARPVDNRASGPQTTTPARRGGIGGVAGAIIGGVTSPKGKVVAIGAAVGGILAVLIARR